MGEPVSIGAYREGFCAMMRAAIARAFAHQALHRGMTIADIVTKSTNPTIGANDILDLMMVPEDTRLSDLGELCWAMDCTLWVEGVGESFVFEVRPNPVSRQVPL